MTSGDTEGKQKKGIHNCHSHENFRTLDHTWVVSLGHKQGVHRKSQKNETPERARDHEQVDRPSAVTFYLLHY